MLSGDLEFGNEEESVRLTKHGVATLTYNENGDATKNSELKIKSQSRRSKVLIYSGTPIKEQIVPYGPFVMNTMG
ncbi:pirin-like protein [Halalkalibacter wakoensis JCM 9140]|uniref:Pirin-like protein n=1 Tax=Halalkalibacter wakoensis JCM 9140 TaxID=1236970 RepID=W4Q5X3_9BACI|nr:pirin-like protein [Halalkalibacter wakoensis JCM 9140]